MGEAVMHAPVLVLNGNFEPLNICSMQRALILVLNEKATIVQNGRGWVQAVSATFPAPSVIRINQVVQRPRLQHYPNRRDVFRRDDYRCQYCGREVAQPTIDHVVPRHQGGGDAWENLVTACSPCNVRKGKRTPEEAHMTLLSQPREPRFTAMYCFGRYLSRYENWRTFLEGW